MENNRQKEEFTFYKSLEFLSLGDGKVEYKGEEKVSQHPIVKTVVVKHGREPRNASTSMVPLGFMAGSMQSTA
jgi:hypothetical protein